MSYVVARDENSAFHGTETIRENRLSKCPITPINEMKDDDRGTYV